MTDTEQTQPARKNNNNLMIGLVVIALIAAVSFTVLAPKNESGQDVDTTSAVTTPQEERTTTTAPAMKAAIDYKNGEYNAVGEYTVPGAKEQLGVTLTLTDGVVTAVEVEQLATLPISKMKQKEFAENYKAQVMGKNIDDVELSKISGSSLTPKGFNDAVEKIKTQAQS